MLQEQIFPGQMSVLQLAFVKDCLGNFFFGKNFFLAIFFFLLILFGENLLSQRFEYVFGQPFFWQKFVFRQNNFCKFFLAKCVFWPNILRGNFFHLRYSLYRQMSQGQILPGQMSLRLLEYVQKGPRNLHLKFGQNRASNS